MNRFVVTLQEGCWLAPWSGDPGRTLVLDSAKLFETHNAAIRALRRALKANPHRHFREARVEPVTVQTCESGGQVPPSASAPRLSGVEQLHLIVSGFNVAPRCPRRLEGCPAPGSCELGCVALKGGPS